MRKCPLGAFNMNLINIINATDEVSRLILELRESGAELDEYQFQTFENSLQNLVSSATGLKPNLTDCEHCKGKGYVDSTT